MRGGGLQRTKVRAIVCFSLATHHVASIEMARRARRLTAGQRVVSAGASQVTSRPMIQNAARFAIIRKIGTVCWLDKVIRYRASIRLARHPTWMKCARTTRWLLSSCGVPWQAGQRAASSVRKNCSISARGRDRVAVVDVVHSRYHTVVGNAADSADSEVACVAGRLRSGDAVASLTCKLA